MKKRILILGLFFGIVGQAWAFDPSGSYSFNMKGMSGDMVVKMVTTADGEPKINVKLDTMNSQANMCDIEADGEQGITSDKSIDVMFVIPKEKTYQQDDTRLQIKFTPKGATIKMLSYGPNGCGMGVGFEGEWIKNKLKKR